MDVQREMSSVDWSAFGSGFADLRVRIALHHGQAVTRDRDYFGAALSRTSRLLDAPSGLQIVLSLASQQLVRDYLRERIRFRDWGEYQLRDLRYSEHIFQLIVPGLPDVATYPRAVSGTPDPAAYQRTDPPR